MSIHPFDGEGLTYEDRLRFWDERADSYDPSQQGSIVDDIVRHLIENKTLTSDSSILELGCGPGTYTLRMAPHVKAVTCVDASPRMMRRMSAEAERMRLTNIEGIVSDFHTLDGGRKFDSVISSLCPGTGGPEGLRLMESLSSGCCAHIMWIRNGWDDVHASIWNALGRGYSFDSRNDDVVTPHLMEMGRDPEVTEFSADISLELRYRDVVSKEIESFSSYGLHGADVIFAVNDVLSKMMTKNIIHFRTTNRMRVITWNTGESRHADD